MLLDRQDMAIAAWNTRVHDTEVSVALARAAALQVTNVEQQQWILACEKAIKTSESRAEEIQQWYHQAEKRERLANSKMMAAQLEMQKMQAERDALLAAMSMGEKGMLARIDQLQAELAEMVMALEAARHEMICAAASGCVRLECVDKALAEARKGVQP